MNKVFTRCASLVYRVSAPKNFTNVMNSRRGRFLSKIKFHMEKISILTFQLTFALKITTVCVALRLLDRRCILLAGESERDEKREETSRRGDGLSIGTISSKRKGGEPNKNATRFSYTVRIRSRWVSPLVNDLFPPLRRSTYTYVYMGIRKFTAECTVCLCVCVCAHKSFSFLCFSFHPLRPVSRRGFRGVSIPMIGVLLYLRTAASVALIEKVPTDIGTLSQSRDRSNLNSSEPYVSKSE